MVTQHGLLLTDTEWAQLPEQFNNKYLKELKGKLLCATAVDCVDTQTN